MFFTKRSIKEEMGKNTLISINDDDILSFGTRRICYVHPQDPSKLIKIARNPNAWEKDHSQSVSEWYLSKKLLSSKMNYRISLCHHWIATNKGPGLVVDKVVDEKGCSLTIRDLLFRKEINPQQSIDLIKEIIHEFSLQGIPACDFHLDNFVMSGNSLQKKINYGRRFLP